MFPAALGCPAQHCLPHVVSALPAGSAPSPAELRRGGPLAAPRGDVDAVELQLQEWSSSKSLSSGCSYVISSDWRRDGERSL